MVGLVSCDCLPFETDYESDLRRTYPLFNANIPIALSVQAINRIIMSFSLKELPHQELVSLHGRLGCRAYKLQEHSSTQAGFHLARFGS